MADNLCKKAIGWAVPAGYLVCGLPAGHDGDCDMRLPCARCGRPTATMLDVPALVSHAERAGRCWRVAHPTLAWASGDCSDAAEARTRALFEIAGERFVRGEIIASSDPGPLLWFVGTLERPWGEGAHATGGGETLAAAVADLRDVLARRQAG